MDALTVTTSTTEVVAPINYIAPTAEKPFSYTYEPPPGKPWRNTRYEPQPMAVRDARRLAEEPTLESAGFTLVNAPSTVRDFHDERQLEGTYYAEVEALVKKLTGASRVVVFDHTIRDGRNAQRDERGAREPVKRAHNDYTLKSGPQRVRDLLPADEAERWLKGRYAIINVWRSIAGTIEQSPLGIVDARSVAFEDFIASDLIYRDRLGETYGVRHNPAHRWFYYPAMTADEAMVFKCYDSATDGRARWTAHSAFDDPTSRPDARPRQSIEIRTLVFFDEDNPQA
ncbi:MAG: methyltransferase [Alphaproteobacteria bacterium]|nr:methyltransferase [Alphaproteobacteria bacterium]MCW5739205.1 methyltransferase [Alphaproteobacteria bacterium]